MKQSIHQIPWLRISNPSNQQTLPELALRAVPPNLRNPKTQGSERCDTARSTAQLSDHDRQVEAQIVSRQRDDWES